MYVRYTRLERESEDLEDSRMYIIKYTFFFFFFSLTMMMMIRFGDDYYMRYYCGY